MKTLVKTTKLLSWVAAIAILGAGCSNSKSSDSTGATGTLPIINGSIPGAVIVDKNNPVGGGSYGGSYFGGATATFTPVSLAVMNQYVGTNPLNNPSDFKINLDLQQVQSGRYGGTVTISYKDNGYQRQGVFRAGTGVNQSFKGMYDNGKLESEFNYWFRYNNQLVFTAYFEDQYGAITVSLVPQSTSAGGNDAEPVISGPYKGYIYFKNFGVTGAGHSPYRSCWHTYTGPYDCRSNIISTKCGLYPGAEAGYKLLGTFTGLDVKKAFNIQ